MAHVGTYQIDGWSPLMFYVGVKSQVIDKTGYGHRLQNGGTIGQFIYMDEIRLYDKLEQDMDSLIQTTRIYSNDIRMPFSLDKCGRTVTKSGRIVKNEDVSLPNGNIADIGEG